MRPNNAAMEFPRPWAENVEAADAPWFEEALQP